MQVAGFDEMQYAGTGGGFIFPADATHRSGMANDGCVKIAFFFGPAREASPPSTPKKRKEVPQNTPQKSSRRKAEKTDVTGTSRFTSTVRTEYQEGKSAQNGNINNYYGCFCDPVRTLGVQGPIDSIVCDDCS